MKAKKKARKEIWCHYRQTWFPLGRARKFCPFCSAAIKTGGKFGHKFRTVKK